MARHASQHSQGGRAAPINRQPPGGSSRPHPWELVLHPIKAAHFIAALAGDPRISGLRKLLYMGPLLILLIAVLLPEGIVAGAVGVVLPVVGPLVDLPADAALDWFMLAIAAYGLLGIFPQRIVYEHHARLFHPRRA